MSGGNSNARISKSPRVALPSRGRPSQLAVKVAHGKGDPGPVSSTGASEISSPMAGNAMPSPLVQRRLTRRMSSKSVNVFVNQMSQAERRAKMRLAKLSDEELLDVEFAAYGDMLRKISWMYLNRPTTSQDQDKMDTEKALKFEPLTQSSALLSFAKDMSICPLLLLEHEVTQAIFQAHQKQTRRVKLLASQDRPFMDFLISCANMTMAKKPFCNVFEKATLKQKVQAMLAFLPLHEPGTVKQIVSARFQSVNNMAELQAAAESEIKRKKQNRRKWRDVPSAREGLRDSWKRIYEVFLYFCDRPALLELPEVDKTTGGAANPAPSTAETEEAQPSVEDGPGMAVNLNKVFNFHPAIRRARTTAAAIKLQTLFRRRLYQHHDLSQSPWTPFKSKARLVGRFLEAEHPHLHSPPHQSGDIDTSMDEMNASPGQVVSEPEDEDVSPGSSPKTDLPGGDRGHTLPVSKGREALGAIPLGIFRRQSPAASDAGEPEGGASLGAGLAGTASQEWPREGPMMVRASGADELLAWMRREMEATPSASSVHSSASSLQFLEVPVLNSRTGAWQRGRVPVKGQTQGGPGSKVKSPVKARSLKPMKSPSAVEDKAPAVPPGLSPPNSHNLSASPGKAAAGQVVARLWGAPGMPSLLRKSGHSASSSDASGDSSPLYALPGQVPRPFSARRPSDGPPAAAVGRSGAWTDRGGTTRSGGSGGAGVGGGGLVGLIAAKKGGARWSGGAWRVERRAPPVGEYFGWRGVRRAVGGMRAAERIWGGGAKKASIFSDDWRERKAAMEEMAWRDFRATSRTEISDGEQQLHQQVLLSWMAGAIRHDKIMDNAASKIQRMGRAWLTRKIVREGKFLRDAAKSWVEAHPPPPLNSGEATMSLPKLFSLARIFAVVPAVVSETELLEIFYERTASGRARRAEVDLQLNWSEFEQMLNDAATRLALRNNPESVEQGTELERLTNLDQLLQIMLAGSEATFDIERPRAWIRQHIEEFARSNQQEHDNFAQVVAATGFYRTPSEESQHRKTLIPEVGAATDGSAAYLNSCANLEVSPIHSLLTQLSEETMDLQHYGLVGNDVVAFASGLRKNQCVRELNLCDTRLEPPGIAAICTALMFNSHIQTVDLSENQLEGDSVKAVADFIAFNSTVHKLALRGVGLTDAGWDVLVRNGIERNKALVGLDVSNNLLGDDSADHIEHIILSKPALAALDLSWNILSKDACDKIQNAVVERSKPRTARTAKAGRHQKLPKLFLVADAGTQRHELIHFKGISAISDPSAGRQGWMSTAEFISMDVVLRDRKLCEELRVRFIRMYTAGKLLQPHMVSQLLQVFFAQSEAEVKARVVAMLLKRLGRPEDVVVVAHELRPNHDFDI